MTLNGKIKRLISTRGFGFILGDDGQEYFLHAKALRGCQFDDLRVGDVMQFTPTSTAKGFAAEEIQRD